jgi:hypothetical protein
MPAPKKPNKTATPTARTRHPVACLIDMLRRRFDSQYGQDAFRARCQDFHDPALHERLVHVVDSAIAGAGPGEADTSVHDGIEHTAVWRRWKRCHVSAQRTIHPHGRNHAIRTDGPYRWSDPDAGPWLVTLDGQRTRFTPGRGFDTPTALLDWFEQTVTT